MKVRFYEQDMRKIVRLADERWSCGARPPNCWFPSFPVTQRIVTQGYRSRSIATFRSAQRLAYFFTQRTASFRNVASLVARNRSSEPLIGRGRLRPPGVAEKNRSRFYLLADCGAPQEAANAVVASALCRPRPDHIESRPRRPTPIKSYTTSKAP